MKQLRPRKQPEETRRKLVSATTELILKRGFNATTVDDICAEAGVTKGSFFHHFENKDAIALAALQTWGEMGRAMYAEAWRKPATPLDEIHKLFDIMEEITVKFDPCVCMVGMIAQEMSGEHQPFRDAAMRELTFWAEMLQTRLQAAQRQLKPSVKFDAAQVAWLLNSIWQGSMLIGKARRSPEMIRANLRLARSFVDSLFAGARKPLSQSKTKPSKTN